MTMDPFAQPSNQGGVSLDDAFVDGFTQMAYSAFEKTAPTLVPRIVTFRVLDVDPETGSGLGAFILDINDDTFYVPVVVSENDVKKIGVFYSPRTDRYYPLTPDWLYEANRSAPPSLGEGVDPPRSLQSDVDVSAAVRPPLGTGRYGFASERSSVAKRAARGELDGYVKRAFTAALNYQPRRKEAAYPRVLKGLPPQIKTAFRTFLQRRPSALQKFARVYGVNQIMAALEPTAQPTPKTAAEGEKRMKRDIFVATAGTPVSRFKEEVGTATGRAYGIARQWGFFAQDLRPGTDKVVRFDPTTLNLTQPGMPGLYTVFLADGSPQEVLIVFNEDPNERSSPKNVSLINLSAEERARRVVVLFKDGRSVDTRATFVAEPVLTSDSTDLNAIVHAWTKDAPGVGEHGFFVSATQGAPISIGPFTISKMSSYRGATTYLQDWGPSVVISPALGARTRLRSSAAGQGNVMLSSDFRWFKTSDAQKFEPEPLLMRSAKEVERAIEARFADSGGVPVDVKVAADGRFVIGRGTAPVDLATAVEKTARAYNIGLPAVLDVLANAAVGTRTQHWVVKTAADKKTDAPPPEEPMDPSMMDPSMMDPSMMAPPPPDGYELAIAEQLQLIGNQVAALNDKAQTLAMLQSRKLQIDGGGGMIAAPTGAASLLAGAPLGPGGGPAMAPPYADPSGGMGMQQGMDPAMMQQGMQQGMPQQGMPQQGMDPAMMQQGMDPAMMQQGMPQGMDPAMMQQGMPQGMDPAMVQQMAPPPRAVMTDAMLSAGDLERAINPDFLDRAAELDQTDVFDAAAIASLAQNRTLRPLVQSYVPNAEETLDNVARLKLNFDLKEGLLKKELGNTEYTDMRQKLDDTFEALGALLLKLNRTTDPVGPTSQAQRQA